MKLAKAACLLAVACVCTPAMCQEGVVKIYARRNSGTVQGTGFFSSDHGQIVTAYHVVEGATRIEVLHDRLDTADIQVDFISPEYDIAVLQILSLIGTTPYFKLANSAPSTADNLETLGYPLGSAKQFFRVHATRNGFVSSKEINDLRGRRLFQNEIEIIPLEMTIYTGMSGGPVLNGGRAIGILSGSYQQGGSIAWAIPCKYIAQLQAVKLKPEQIRKWPQLALMSSAWGSLRGMVRLNSSAAAVYDQFIDEIDTLARTYDELHKQAQTTSRDFAVLRPFLDRVVGDPSLANNPEAAHRLLENPRNTAAESLKKFSELSDSAGNTGRQISATMINIFTWIADQSNIDSRSGKELVRKMTAIRDQHKDMLQGLDKYLNVDGNRILNSLPELTLALQRSKTPADEARAFIRFADVWQPLFVAYGSPQALIFMSGATSTFRQIGQLFEPVVYQTGPSR